MSECLCFVCNSPAPNNLAMLCKCNHVAGHATCVTPFVTQHGRCPVPNCAQPAVASDVLVLCIDPPQPNGFSQNDLPWALEMMGTFVQSLVEHPQNANASENDREKVAQSVKDLTSRGAVVDNGWKKKLIALFKIAAVVALGVLCWYCWPLVVAAGGSLFESLTSLVIGLAPLLRKYFSEIVVSGSMGAFFSTLAFGIKKIVD